ncbi:uncharacterized protein Dana_GF16503 [Drosophila ananassae]|uniref:Uncharacterized protein n=1 Tax=Drosophila ananassae TaxID=7217 RepID=B3M2U8_DROAN|nr:uncharacterized protein LOC6499299 [Drosophila ananassae]EDV43478.1 uncharacterized protein Dana_GF16503 [Drosophila ananassae]
MGIMRTVGGVSGEGQPQDMPIATVSHCPIYRQVLGAGTGAGSAPAKRVPVLFSTNRGLYLRQAPPPSAHSEVMSLQPRSQNYNISFCDLERWSTNRANVVSLEDTFTVMQQRNMSPESLNYQPRLWKNNVSYSLMR